MRYKKWQILIIDWVDSMHGYKTWTHEEDVDVADKYLYKKTVGMFLTETKEAITVVQSRDDDGEEKHNVDSVMSIPKVSIKKINHLKGK